MFQKSVSEHLSGGQGDCKSGLDALCSFEWSYIHSRFLSRKLALASWSHYCFSNSFTAGLTTKRVNYSL